MMPQTYALSHNLSNSSSKTSFHERVIEFLNESNKIEEFTYIDYHDEKYCLPSIGHYGAFLLSQQAIAHQIPLTLKMLCKWQAMIITEELTVRSTKRDKDENFIGADDDFPKEGIGNIRGVECRRNVIVGDHTPPDWQFVAIRISELISKINSGIASINANEKPTDADKVQLIADSFQQFEAIHPFLDGNGRVGRLLANYIASRIKVPLIVFRESKKSNFYQAHKSKVAMRCFFAEQYIESVFFKKQIWYLERSPVSSYPLEYVNKLGKKMSIEWYALRNKVQDWTRACCTKQNRSLENESFLTCNLEIKRQRIN